MKFKIKDGEDEYEVEEIDEVDGEDVDIDNIDMDVKDDNSLTPEEISSLKSLASVADKLIALVNTDSVEDEDIDENIDEDVDENIDGDIDENIDGDIDGDIDEDVDEEIIDTKTKSHDSRSSYGAMSKQKKVVDSDLASEDIASAWQKRYKEV